VLQRIVWLNKNGVAFTFDFEQEKKSLKNICPKWRDENIKEIDKLSSGDTFSITNNEDFKELKGIEDSKLIDTADFHTPYLLVT
jgi:hypothetical protein